MALLPGVCVCVCVWVYIPQCVDYIHISWTCTSMCVHVDLLVSIVRVWQPATVCVHVCACYIYTYSNSLSTLYLCQLDHVVPKLDEWNRERQRLQFHTCLRRRVGEAEFGWSTPYGTGHLQQNKPKLYERTRRRITQARYVLQLITAN